MEIPIEIHSEERIDDLQIKGLRIIQNPSQFCFGVDAVLLSHYAAQTIKPNTNVLDFCSGNGIVPILLHAKSEAAHITGLEIQANIAEMAKRSILLNKLQNQISMVCGDVKDAPKKFGKGTFDYITCNPPYKEAGGGITNEFDAITIARHEIYCTLADIIEAAEHLLKPGGKLCIVHRPERLVDILACMRKSRIEPKRLRFVHPSPYKTAAMILIEGTKHGKPKLFLDPPLYIYEEKGRYSAEIDEIYCRKRGDKQ